MLRDSIVCRINDTGRHRHQQLLVEIDLMFEAIFKMVQTWETVESNAKGLQKLRIAGLHLTVNKTV